MTVNSLIFDPMDWIGKHCANGSPTEDTVRAYQKNINDFLQWWEENKGHSVFMASQSDIMEYRRYLADVAGYSLSTVSLKLSAVRRFFDATHQLGHSAANPAKGVAVAQADRGKPINHRTRVFSSDDAEKIRESLPADDSLCSIRNRTIISLMLVDGLRRVDIARVRLGDIRRSPEGSVLIMLGCREIKLQKSTVTLLQLYLGKLGYVQFPPITALHKNVFVRMLKGGRPGGPLCRRSVSDIVDEILRSAGVKQEGMCCRALRGGARNAESRGGGDGCQ